MLRKTAAEPTQYAYKYGEIDRSELTSFKKRFAKLAAEQKHEQAKRMLIRKARAWVQKDRQPLAVNAFQHAQVVWNRMKQTKYAANCVNDCVRVLLRRGQTHLPTRYLGNAIKIIKEKKTLSFQEIDGAVKKMIDADIFGRDEPFEGPYRAGELGTDAIPHKSRIIGQKRKERT